MTSGSAKNKRLIKGVGEKTADVLEIAQEVVHKLSANGLFITTVESCTGGALASAITDIAGSSEVLTDSFITYSNESKFRLGVPEKVVEHYTVYSLEVAIAMAHAGIKRSVKADIGVGITGSLTRIDPANQNSTPGRVYVGIVVGDTEVKLPLVVQETSRVESKLQIVEHTLNAVSELLA